MEKNDEVDYIVSTPGRPKAKWLCHEYMLKPYHDRQDLEGDKAATIVVPAEHESVKPDGDGEDKEVIRLKNSDISNNLDQKLKHLPNPRKNVITGYFAGIHPGISRCSRTNQCSYT